MGNKKGVGGKLYGIEHNEFVYKYEHNMVLTFSTVLQSVAECILEHYDIPNTTILINTDVIRFINSGGDEYNKRMILYNWEHKYGGKHSSTAWTNHFNDSLQYVDIIWDFNVENYQYYESIGRGKDFRFVPCRYTNWFEKFNIPNEQRKIDFSLFFSGTINTTQRFMDILAITEDCGLVANVIPFKLCNTNNNTTRYAEMQTCKYVIDIPHYDESETINSLRIFESLCLNIPVICHDKYNIGSDKYFNDLIIKVKDLNNMELRNICKMPPRDDVAKQFKALTYTDNDYENYRLSILRDFYDKTKIMVPDSALFELK